MADKKLKEENLWDRDAFMHSLAHILGTISPFIIVLLVCIFTPNGNLWKFLKEGEFCLFSAAILTPAAYTFHAYKPKKLTTTTGKFQRWAETLWPISIAMIGISAILFLLIYIHKIKCTFEIHGNSIVVISIIFLLASFIIFYISRYIHKDVPDHDVPLIHQNEEDDLKAGYKKTKES